MADGSFFGLLRNLASQIDEETNSLKEQVVNRRSKGKPESAELLLLELQNEMKTLYANVNKTLHEVKKNDDHFMELVPLCQSVVVQQAEKLANIEDYLGKYGYIPPDIRPVGDKNDSTKCKTTDNSAEAQKRVNPEGELNELEDKTELTNERDEQSPTIEHEHSDNMQTPKSQMKRNSDSSEDRTPQPEDYGFSLGDIMRKYKKVDKITPAKDPCFKMPIAPQHLSSSNAFETPQNFQHRGLCVTPGLLGSNVSGVTPVDSTYFAGGRGEFDHHVPTLKFNCDSDGSPETPVLRTPGLNGKMSRRECHYGQEDNTIALFEKGKQPLHKQAISSILEDDDWDNSPIPPVLTSGVVQIPKRDKTGISKFQLCEPNPNEDNSPVAPVLMTSSVAKQFEKKHRQNFVESTSEGNSPVVPELLTPGIKIPKHIPAGFTKYDKAGSLCEESSPKLPALHSMTEDISKLELPTNPVLCSTMASDDDDIPEPPELTTINLRTLTTQHQMLKYDSELSSRQVLGEIQDPSDFPKEPSLKTIERLPNNMHIASHSKENENLSTHGNIPERLRKLSTEEYSSLSSYITRQLSVEIIDNMTAELNKILFHRKSAGVVEEVHSSDINDYLGDKAKMFILVMRQLGKLQVKGKGAEVAYVVA